MPIELIFLASAMMLFGVFFLFSMVRGTGSPQTTSPASQSLLQATVQQIVFDVANATGYGFSVGYIDTNGLEFGVAAGYRTTRNVGLPLLAPGNMTVNDTIVLGSGTKPYTAAGVLRLVDAGVVTLNDSVASHIDNAMTYMWNTTLKVIIGLLRIS